MVLKSDNYNMFLITKRCLDIILSFNGMIFLISLFPIFGMIIKLESKGPVLFRQKRLGKNGKPFMIYKFRSMVNDAEKIKPLLMSKNEVNGPMFKIEDDPRLTKFGRLLRRLKLDELPQLWNVLKGDLSFVGPRPLSEEEMGSKTKWREMRLKVKPGITGLWQVNCNDYRSFDEWLYWDTYYVRNQSLSLDIKIFAKTIILLAKFNLSLKPYRK